MITVSDHAIGRIVNRDISPEDVLFAIRSGRRFIQRGDHKIRHTARTASGLICVLTSPDAQTIITVFKIKKRRNKKGCLHERN